MEARGVEEEDDDDEGKEAMDDTPAEQMMEMMSKTAEARDEETNPQVDEATSSEAHLLDVTDTVQ